ncbi:MAG: hypothetical protein KGL95_01340 [Patescibacteria group bacterium]|nr:hypothetical protein [Patescibacteria group bacterium]
MSDTNPFGSLKIDVWYKTFIVLGGIVIFASLFYNPKFISQKELFVIGIGLFLIGVGEWKNARFGSQFITQSAFNPFIRIPLHGRVNDRVGVPLEILGIIAIGIGFLSFFKIVTWLN